VADREIDGERYERRLFVLPRTLPQGYHTLLLALDGHKPYETRLIVAPPRAWLPPEMADDQRLWGIVCQLYSLRSAGNWGIGNFADLGEVARLAAEQGADIIGINPLHALFPINPEHASPYSPSSREFLNTIYIDTQAVPDFAACAEAQAMVAAPDFQARLERARASELVDYSAVSALIMPVLEVLYAHFREHHLARGTERARAFHAFRRSFEQGADPQVLENFAVFMALQESFAASDPALLDWQTWPQEYHDPDSPAVHAFAADHVERIEYHIYLQWVADTQLGEAMAAANRAAGGTVRLYLDRAVGVGADSAAAWSDHVARLLPISVGAPPDPFNQLGQNWGLKPYSPIRMREDAFKSYIAVLRSNMRHAGALRIDHIAGMRRLYWVPVGQSADRGAYVRYPLEEMLRILALESHRRECLVIGEDLGTIPEGLSEALNAANVLSYRVLQFERYDNGLFRDARDYPRAALVTAGTHDLPTLGGMWTGRDLEWRQRLDLYRDADARRRDVEARVTDRRRLVDALIHAGLWPAEPPTDTETHPLDAALLAAIHAFLARTPCALMMVALEDVLGQVEQMNLPGTIDEHPNWRRKLHPSLDEVFRDPAVLAALAAVRAERGSSSDRSRG
jgi:4-alpha-glucanotransferase